ILKNNLLFLDTVFCNYAKISNPWEINLGVGLQGRLGETIIYGGPVAYWARSKAEASLTWGGTVDKG
ncbi:MAG: hypothetical protein QMD07_03360, partial [Thermodesulfovibrionales bacterium]|nr:hypothetical protein [Thermodesulfovibrionales bacterium]